ncbi:MAG: class I SAM-dependent methyltransferase [Chloroflexi bacterium]|nr:class I SAM-dependent methyltransferase [Chloroflexota bacterium]
MHYDLLDAGVRRRLERFGAHIIDRPAPGADGFRLAPGQWVNADLRFDAGSGWSGPAWPAEPWPVEIDGLTMELRPTTSGGLGLYPEHAANLAWLAAQVGAQVSAGAADGAVPQVLNLFAHTGLATLAMARAGAAVAHVDGARAAVAWARRNAELSGLADRPVRWLVDDAAAFAAREARRGRRYDGIVLDPPAFGRADGREWRLEEDLPALLTACRTVAAPDAFVLLTAHSESVDGTVLAAMLRSAFGGRSQSMEVVPLDLAATSGARLALGWAVRRGS